MVTKKKKNLVIQKNRQYEAYTLQYKRLFILIGIVLFLLLIYRTGVEKIIAALRTINPVFLFLLPPVLVIDALLKGSKWRLIINSFAIEYPLLESTKVFLIGVFAGLITPGRAGDLVRANYLKKTHNSYSDCLSTVLVDRFIDIGVLAVLGSISLVLFSTFFTPLGVIYVMIAVLLGGYVVFLVIFFNEQFMRKILTRLNSQRLITIYDKLLTLNKKKLLQATILGFVAWVISTLEARIIAYSMNLPVSYAFLFMCIPIITFAEILPITISGFGTRELAFVTLFGLLKIPSELAIAFSLMYVVLAYWLSALIGLLLSIKME